MIPQKLLDKIICPNCENADFDVSNSSQILKCKACNSEFPVKSGIPSIMKGGPEKQDWNPWDLDKLKMIGDSYYKRATGELPEKESSKSYANLIVNRKLYNKGDSFLDIGCATGHFLKSFRRIIDEDIVYTGIDSTDYYLQWGKEVFGQDDTSNFVHCDALNLPFKNSSFDYVVVNLFHFFPNIIDALTEVLRVAKKQVIWRTPLGEINYMVKMVYDNDFKKLGVLAPERSDFFHSIYMIYNQNYIRDLIQDLGHNVTFIDKDDDFEDFDNTNLKEMEHISSTKTINGMQVNGNLILDWHYIGISASKSQ